MILRNAKRWCRLAAEREAARKDRGSRGEEQMKKEHKERKEGEKADEQKKGKILAICTSRKKGFGNRRFHLQS